ncbi:hypothetical protein [uncultured Aquimarina sp.]|uniref:hypothetical protein n=1 Tax=uncultured Aquimarina sp. TaxID=575652 RepID=UPI002638BD38|nr:hypothetical protein [uncultured Aquimarina sp.]
MKNYALLFLFALICCKSESKSPNDTTVSNNITNSENVSDVTTTDNSNPRTYSIQGTSSAKKGENSKKNGGNFSQNLSIQWISDTSIQYTLTYSNGSCNKTVGGRATIVKAKNEPFAISHNGKSVEVDKYKDTKQGFDIILQIDAQSKDKASVNLVFTEDDGNENCTPESAVMLEQK